MLCCIFHVSTGDKNKDLSYQGGSGALCDITTGWSPDSVYYQHCFSIRARDTLADTG